MPPKRKLLILINPFSGAGAANRAWEKARIILEKCHVELTIILTERAMHAYEIVHTDIQVGQYNGIVTVSGDGLIQEVVNGIYRRKDWMHMMSSTVIGFIP